MSYTVLARRYRSQTFSDVVGQEAVARTLTNAIQSNRVAHAYLFTGTRGVGKTTMARILAKALNCLKSDGPTATPCCECESCLAINEGEDIDVIEIDGASNTGVEHIRELRQNAIYRPARARYKIYIIDEVHMLSTSAFNALLKTLEEPPDHVKFIFATTEANKILPTILSRCQRFDFRNLSRTEIADQLREVLKGEKIEAEDALINRVARLANGSMRDGLSLMDQLLSMGDGKLTLAMLADLLGTPPTQRLIALTEAVGRGSLADMLKQIDEAINEGLALETLAQAMQQQWRDLMIIRNCGEATDLVDFDEENDRKQMAELAKRFDDATLVYYVTIMEELRRSLRSGGASRALFEAAMVRMTACGQFSDTAALIEQLQQLEHSIPAESGGEVVQPAAATAPPPAAKMRPAEPAPSAGGVTQKVRQTEPTPVAGGVQPKADKSEKTAVGLAVPDELTLAFLQSNWQAVLDGLAKQGDKIEEFISAAEPVKWLSPRLTLSFALNRKDQYELIRSQPFIKTNVEKALAGVLGQTKLMLEVEVKSIGSAPANNGRNHVPPGSKPSQAEINKAMADPKVIEVQRILGGKVRQIDRLNQ